MSGLVHVGAWEGREYVGHPGPLVLFEPQTGPFKQLVANLGKQEGVVCVNLALGAKAGTAEMHTSSPDHSSSLLAPKKHLELYPAIKFNGTEKVQVSTLDREMKAIDGEFKDLVIDVQGYELEVLKGGTKTLEGIERITCEVNTDEVYEDCARMDEIDAFLEIRGFKRVVTDMWGGICGDAVYTR